jgi:hypothetical protein
MYILIHKMSLMYNHNMCVQTRMHMQARMKHVHWAISVLQLHALELTRACTPPYSCPLVQGIHAANGPMSRPSKMIQHQCLSLLLCSSTCSSRNAAVGVDGDGLGFLCATSRQRRSLWQYLLVSFVKRKLSSLQHFIHWYPSVYREIVVGTLSVCRDGNEGWVTGWGKVQL